MFFDRNNFNLPETEEKVLDFWRKNKTFEKVLSAGKGKKTFVFYEGPPYANGKPGIHHVLARVYKDIILRYKTMRGYFVPRRAGWDTHGLPIEIEVEKALGIKNKKEIEKVGIEVFNEKAREVIFKYKEEWERFTERIGYWLDLKNAYVTYENDYIETLWWIVKRIYENGLFYRGYKVVPWCVRCGTALSSHELAQGYREIEDASVYLKFKLKPNQKIGKFTVDRKTYVLSWTTTPWTLPGNVALAAGKDINYVAVRQNKETLILAKDMVEATFGTAPDITAEFKGKDLEKLAYEPLFNIKSLRNKNSYKIYLADFVTTSEGTGIVHIAVMYGEDDFALGEKVGLPKHHTVTEEGKFVKDVPMGLAGKSVKDKKTEEKITSGLKKSGNLFKTEIYVHEYPFCWRCGTPLLYYARDSWFVGISKLRKKLIFENQTINWIPEHIKRGRFGEWLKEAKDWNFSRERYWGTPLPVWECLRCGHREVLGSMDELSRKLGGARNSYWAMRHGEAENNVKHIIDFGQKKYRLTKRGQKEARASALKLKKEKINLIIASDIERTKETAKIAAEVLGIKKVVFDKRLREIHLPGFAGCHSNDYHAAFPTYESKFISAPKGGESLRDLRRRMWGFLKDIEKKYRGKKILLISHEYTIWMLQTAACGWSEEKTIEEKKKREPDFINLAEERLVEFLSLPRNDGGEVDLHRPYVDGAMWPCSKCPKRANSVMRRIKEVADVWFDSGAMPFASIHYPFENASLIDKRKTYPADYISEAVDQTRGWFYNLLAVSTALGFEAPYKNVICLGLINDKHGQKMSKSKGNVVDSWEVMKKYGADAVRWYFYSATPPEEPKNFDENELKRIFRQFHLLLYNSMIFWRTYGRKTGSSRVGGRNVLDRWILARLAETGGRMARHLDAYDVRGAALAAEEFVGDLSRWYIRRSRRRFSAVAKGFGGQAKVIDYNNASHTLQFVLSEFSKLIAPFTPFFAEALFEELSRKNAGSVHLENWPKMPSLKSDKKLIYDMTEIRRLASLALALRAEKGIKVRQPLSKLKIKNEKLKTQKELLEILKDEVNVKEVIFDKNAEGEVDFDFEITPKLKEEGILRDLMRMIAELRQKANLKPNDKITLAIEAGEPVRGIVERNEKFIKAESGAKKIEYKKSAKMKAEIEGGLEGEKIWLGLKKAQ